MRFNLKDKLNQARDTFALASVVASGLTEQAKAKLAQLSDTAHEKIETATAVAQSVVAVAPMVYQMKKAELQQTAGQKLAQFRAAAADLSGKAIEALSPAHPEAPQAAETEEHHEEEAPAVVEAAPAANDSAPKTKKAASKTKKKKSAPKAPKAR